MPSAESRDDAEKALELAAAASTKAFLERTLAAARDALRTGAHTRVQPVIALGTLLGWWTSEVDDRIVTAIRGAWTDAFSVTGPDAAASVSARADAMAFHIVAVKDRLSRQAMPEIPEAAFEQVRASQSAAALGGWSIDRQARDIAERLSWEDDKTYWKEAQAAAEAEIDAILDPLGPPGTPARTHAHKTDPAVKEWQRVRAEAVERLHEDEDTWKVRATRIARTEATAAWNSGALAALQSEGRTGKKWRSHIDDRTRHSHVEADGQVVPLASQFRVGDSLLTAPGDPSGPPWEVINCRCTVVGADWPVSVTAAADWPTPVGEEVEAWLSSVPIVGEHGPVLVAVPEGSPLVTGESMEAWLGGFAVEHQSAVLIGRWPVLQKFVATLTTFAAGGGGHSWRDQLRIPRGNGARSGRWTFTPWKHLDDLTGLLDALGASSQPKTREIVAEAVDLLKGFDPNNFDVHDPELARATKKVADLLDSAPKTGDKALDDTMADAAAGVRDFADTDWSLFAEATDIGAAPDAGRTTGGNVWNGGLPSDEPVNEALKNWTSQELADELEKIKAHPVAPSPTTRKRRASYLKELNDRRDRDQTNADQVDLPAPSEVPTTPPDRNPDFGKRTKPVTTRYNAINKGVDFIETVGGPKVGDPDVERVLYNVRRQEGVWGVFPPTSQSPALYQAESKIAAMKWAQDRVNGVPDPEAEPEHPLPPPVTDPQEVRERARLANHLTGLLAATDPDDAAGLIRDIQTRAMNLPHDPGKQTMIMATLLAGALDDRNAANWKNLIKTTIESLDREFKDQGPSVWTVDFNDVLKEIGPKWQANLDALTDKAHADLLARYGEISDEQRTPEEIVATIGAYYTSRANNSNCVLASVAYELRRRGLDVQPKRASNGRNAEHTQDYWFQLGHDRSQRVENLHRLQLAAKYARIVDHIEGAYPAGSRGTIRAGWKGRRFGHIWNWERGADGAVSFHDAQTGLPVLPDDASYWVEMDPNNTTVQRLDDKPLLPNVEVAVAPKDVASKTQQHLALARQIQKWSLSRTKALQEMQRLDRLLWSRKNSGPQGEARREKLRAQIEVARDRYRDTVAKINLLKATPEFRAMQADGNAFPELNPNTYTL